ncbi:putative UPF0481 protein [Senna tora]|uniref:Putative UPF0481 protein n=1 Tax=Senna tora TaxID=362788 RepID=A0A834WAK5_9FABA|nr:putative UPF0481 protein [Senna tora]
MCELKWVGDTCVAMEDWLEHPENRTVLTKLLPCVDDATAKQAQDLTRNTSLEIVTMANEFLRNVANSDKSPGQEEEGKIGVFLQSIWSTSTTTLHSISSRHD